ncbi:hypothetical protein BGW38_009847, partial [Lunasporangiospora selenospora]
MMVVPYSRPALQHHGPEIYEMVMQQVATALARSQVLTNERIKSIEQQIQLERQDTQNLLQLERQNTQNLLQLERQNTHSQLQTNKDLILRRVQLDKESLESQIQLEGARAQSSKGMLDRDAQSEERIQKVTNMLNTLKEEVHEVRDELNKRLRQEPSGSETP